MKISVSLKPFSVPNFVLVDVPVGKRQDGFKESPSYHLSDVDSSDLSDLCDKFRQEVFKKAKKQDPKKGATHES